MIADAAFNGHCPMQVATLEMARAERGGAVPISWEDGPTKNNASRW
jgi:hypothetical protein